jgi:hypothetical protein
LLAAYGARDYARVASFKGELLQDFTYDDEEDSYYDLNAWLERWRLKLRHSRREAMEKELEALEKVGQLKEALGMALRLLEWEPKSEKSYQHVMRLHHRLGDRAAALEVYLRCREIVKKEFGAGLSKETSELAREIERSDAARPRPAIPLSVDHPPVLAGREREWALMERAWAARQPMLVDGESGIGKTRLVTEFGFSRGRCILINGRPGDQETPYATHMRCLPMVMKEVPGVPMPPQVRRELSRLVPKLHPEPLPLPQTPEERAQLSRAVIDFLRDVLPGVDVLVFDDAQYMDRYSAELGLQVHSAFKEEMAAGRFPLIINVFRTSEVGDWVREQIKIVIESRMMCRVEVRGLDVAAVKQMLEEMGEPNPQQAAEKLVPYTGGNPLFIVELVRHRREAGFADWAFLESSSPPELIRVMIEKRLARLSPEALRLARFFAVARTDFSVELASKVLEVPVDQLAVPWRELEQAHIIQGPWFVHDLMGEVILATLPEPIRVALTERIAHHRPTR